MAVPEENRIISQQMLHQVSAIKAEQEAEMGLKTRLNELEGSLMRVFAKLVNNVEN